MIFSIDFLCSPVCSSGRVSGSGSVSVRSTINEANSPNLRGLDINKDRPKTTQKDRKLHYESGALPLSHSGEEEVQQANRRSYKSVGAAHAPPLP